MSPSGNAKIFSFRAMRRANELAISILADCLIMPRGHWPPYHLVASGFLMKYFMARRRTYDVELRDIMKLLPPLTRRLV